MQRDQSPGLILIHVVLRETKILAELVKNMREVRLIVDGFAIVDSAVAVPSFLVEVQDARNDRLNDDPVSEAINRDGVNGLYAFQVAIINLLEIEDV